MKRHFPDAPQGLGGGWGGVGGGWVAAIFTEVVPRATPAASRESHWAISYWLTRNRARIAAAAAAAASAAAAAAAASAAAVVIVCRSRFFTRPRR